MAGRLALVYVDAFIPSQGQSIADLLAAKPGSCIADPATAFNPVTEPGGLTDLYLQPSAFPGCFASGLPASEAEVLAATQRPLATAAATGKSGTPAWKTIPSWAVVGTADQGIPPAEMTAMARHAGRTSPTCPPGTCP